jgi:predicted NACHT family NTPase
MLDGIDEVRESRRPTVINWLRHWTTWYPEAFYVVTSRPAAIREEWRDDLRALGFATAKLEPMTQVQVSDFIDRWYGAVVESGRYRYYRNPGDVERLVGRLKVDLASRPDLLSLATNPLLCAVICAINLHMSQLPTQRTELYQMALSLLLEQRDVYRGIRGAEQLSLKQSLSMLARIALWMLMNGQDSIPRRSALKEIADVSPGLSDRQTDYLLRQLLEQTGLLQKIDKDLIELRYQSFQDYLAATEILRKDLADFLIINSHKPTYHDVVVNAVELASTQTKRELLTGLIERARSEADANQRRQLWLVAADCLHDVEQVGDLADQIQNGLRRVQST